MKTLSLTHQRWTALKQIAAKGSSVMKLYIGSKQLAVLVKSIIGIILAANLIDIVHAGTIYISTENAKLYAYDTITKTSIAIGSTGVTMTDMAFDPSGQLWGVDGFRLYKINVTTGGSTLVGVLGTFASTLASGSDGTLYTASGADFYTVDKVTGAASYRGFMNFPAPNFDGDLEFAGSGKLYLAAVPTGTGMHQLVQINPANGSGTRIGNTQVLNGLAFTDGVLFGIMRNYVLTLDPTTTGEVVVSLYDVISTNEIATGASSPWHSYSPSYPGLSLNGSLLTIQLNAGDNNGKNADWWVVAQTPWGHWFSYVYPNRWVDIGTDLSRVSPAYQGQLADISSLALFDTNSIPYNGNYVFYFGVDTNTNGALDYNQLSYTSLPLTINNGGPVTPPGGIENQ